MDVYLHVYLTAWRQHTFTHANLYYTAVSTGGLTYIQWGSSSCAIGAATLYSGIMSGAHFGQPGGANYLCLPPKPEYGDLDTTFAPVPQPNRIGRIYGTEYEFPISRQIISMLYVPGATLQTVQLRL